MPLIKKTVQLNDIAVIRSGWGCTLLAIVTEEVMFRLLPSDVWDTPPPPPTNLLPTQAIAVINIPDCNAPNNVLSLSDSQ